MVWIQVELKSWFNWEVLIDSETKIKMKKKCFHVKDMRKWPQSLRSAWDIIYPLKTIFFGVIGIISPSHFVKTMYTWNESMVCLWQSFLFLSLIDKKKCLLVLLRFNCSPSSSNYLKNKKLEYFFVKLSANLKPDFFLHNDNPTLS